MDKKYTRQELESMTPMELCAIACELGIIDVEELVRDIWDMRGKDE